MEDKTDSSFDCIMRAWQAHERELFAYLIHRLGPKDAAEDLLQEIFLKTIKQGDNFRRIENPRAWLFKVARNTVIDQSRTTRSFVQLPKHLTAPPADERAPVEELDGCLARNLREMAAEDQQIINACDLAGQTVNAYAQANSLSLAAAKSRLLRARRRLHNALLENCHVNFDDAGKVCCHVPRDSA